MDSVADTSTSILPFLADRQEPCLRRPVDSSVSQRHCAKTWKKCPIHMLPIIHAYYLFFWSIYNQSSKTLRFSTLVHILSMKNTWWYLRGSFLRRFCRCRFLKAAASERGKMRSPLTRLSGLLCWSIRISHRPVSPVSIVGTLSWLIVLVSGRNMEWGREGVEGKQRHEAYPEEQRAIRGD